MTFDPDYIAKTKGQLAEIAGVGPNQRTSWWVRFDDEGRAAWFGEAWVDGAEFVEGVTAETMVRCRRVGGAWIERAPAPQVEPTAEERAAERAEADRQAVEAREAAIDAAILASPEYRAFLRGQMTLTAYREAAEKIADGFPPVEQPA